MSYPTGRLLNAKGMLIVAGRRDSCRFRGGQSTREGKVAQQRGAGGDVGPPAVDVNLARVWNFVLHPNPPVESNRIKWVDAFA